MDGYLNGSKVVTEGRDIEKDNLSFGSSAQKTGHSACDEDNFGESHVQPHQRTISRWVIAAFSFIVVMALAFRVSMNSELFLTVICTRPLDLATRHIAVLAERDLTRSGFNGITLECAPGYEVGKALSAVSCTESGPYAVEGTCIASNPLAGFHDKFTGGGMTKAEQALLARTYANASSIFEWGMGSSTLIAAHLKIKRLTAVDSASSWVDNVRGLVPHASYELIYANIGPIGAWGSPTNASYRSSWPDYSAQVDREADPFDVYLVDGRFRVACACKALLHGRRNSLILVHDFARTDYHILLTVADVVTQERNLVVLRRKPKATDDKIRAMWDDYKFTKG